MVANAVEGQRRLGIREEAGLGLILDTVLVQLDAGGLFGVQQRVEVPSGRMGLGTATQPCLGPDSGAAVGDIPIVCVQGVAHALAPETDSIADVGGVDVFELGHDISLGFLVSLPSEQVDDPECTVDDELTDDRHDTIECVAHHAPRPPEGV